MQEIIDSAYTNIMIPFINKYVRTLTYYLTLKHIPGVFTVIYTDAFL